MVLKDSQIRELCLTRGMITPFSEAVSGNGVISWGLTAAGYDVRLGQDFLLFENTAGVPLDPKSVKRGGSGHFFRRVTVPVGESLVVPPNSCVLGHTVETFHMPDDVKGRCDGKSTYARVAILVNVTPLEPGWCGQLTLEISNTSKVPVVIYPGEGIAQIEFHKLDGPVETCYAAKGGKYQGQTGVTASIVE